MDVVIFAGGFGTRLSEETHAIPKPMVEIGGIPILIHIMRYYSKFGANSFVICGGYKVDYIKNYFKNYMENVNDFELNFKSGEIVFFNKREIDWKVKIIDTGLHTMTAGRLKRVSDYVSTENFFLTYGDGLSDINLKALHNEHIANSASVTLSAVIPPARFGALRIDGNKVNNFDEKPVNSETRVNGGFMVVNNSVFSDISSDEESFEVDILPKLALRGCVSCHMHDSFWHPMDTLRDKNLLEDMWSKGAAPWAT
jgi:glucose-1-phosphate cytidylyltransferase